MSEQDIIDKKMFKKIFEDNWEEFKRKYPKYGNNYYDEVIKKMLLCGEEESGYAIYRCYGCGEEKTVCFSCKSCFCLSCSRVYVENWVEYIGTHLYEGIHYRHIVLTVPDDLRIFFYRHKEEKVILNAFIKCGIDMLNDAVETYKKKKLSLGFICVLQRVGRPGN